MARHSRYDQDRASSPGFPRQSDPIGSTTQTRGTARRTSQPAPQHHAEIIDFQHLSDARHQVNAADQHASFSAFVSSRTRQVNHGQGASSQPEHAAAGASRNRKQQASHSSFQGMASVRGILSRFVGKSSGEGNDASAQAGRDGSLRAAGASSGERSSQDKKHRAFPIHFSFDWFRSSRPAQVSALVCACLILGCAFVYPSAKDAYTAVRNADQAEAEYQAVLNRNDEIQNRINTLQTDEGIEDLARNSYGYVMEGEHSVRVSGLGAQSIAADAENQTPAVAAGSVAPTDTWYSPVLDVVFGYTPDNATTSADDSSE